MTGLTGDPEHGAHEVEEHAQVLNVLDVERWIG
jgi:hypothetical protein